MSSRRITTADLVGVTGFSRHRLRSFLKDFPDYADKQIAPRVAREYSRQDFAVIVICCALEEYYGWRRDAIAVLAAEVRKAVGVPRALAADALLIVTPNPPSVRYVDGLADVREGTVLPLSEILNRIDVYLLGDHATELRGQRDLDFRPVRLLNTEFSNTSKSAYPRRVSSKNAVR